MRSVTFAAPCSGSGKTVITFGILRALYRKGLSVCSAKVGPDYIDPVFHEIACKSQCVNLDPWAMSSRQIRQIISTLKGDYLFIEGVMGMFDGTFVNDKEILSYSTAGMAHSLDSPTVLVVDASKQLQSIAATVHGFNSFNKNVEIAAIILNRLSSAKQERIIVKSLSVLGIPIIGTIPKHSTMSFGSRHLGLVQAREIDDQETRCEEVASLMSDNVDLDYLVAITKDLPMNVDNGGLSAPRIAVLPPPGSKISISRDKAFSFVYPHILNEWKILGAQINYFSPLQDEIPDMKSDFIYLCGGYPELHAEDLAKNSRFFQGMQEAARKGIPIYGECGGYMVLGNSIQDSSGCRYQMLGLLDHDTSMLDKKLTLGYAKLFPNHGFPWNVDALMAHEFHYATEIPHGSQDNFLFEAESPSKESKVHIGGFKGRVGGSFAHVIGQYDHEEARSLTMEVSEEVSEKK